jgi:hypothetical protein
MDATRKENYRPIKQWILMQRFSTKYLQIEFNNTSKWSYTINKSVSLPGCRDGSTYVNP